MSNSVKRTVTKAALKILPIDKLQVDQAYQREVKPRHKKIASQFDEHALGIPVVGEREGATYWIVDGLQRITALKLLGKKEVRCEVFPSRGVEHEAEVFKKINLNRTKLSAAEEFRSLLAGQDKEAWAIKECIEKEGFTLVLSGKSSIEESAWLNVVCINTLRTVYERNNGDFGLRAISFALKNGKACWPGDRLVVYNLMIAGLARFFILQKGIVDEERFQSRLKLVTPQKILFTAGQMVGNTKDNNVAEVLEKLYKRRHMTKKN